MIRMDMAFTTALIRADNDGIAGTLRVKLVDPCARIALSILKSAIPFYDGLAVRSPYMIGHPGIGGWFWQSMQKILDNWTSQKASLAIFDYTFRISRQAGPVNVVGGLRLRHFYPCSGSEY